MTLFDNHFRFLRIQARSIRRQADKSMHKYNVDNNAKNSGYCQQMSENLRNKNTRHVMYKRLFSRQAEAMLRNASSLPLVFLKQQNGQVFVQTRPINTLHQSWYQFFIKSQRNIHKSLCNLIQSVGNSTNRYFDGSVGVGNCDNSIYKTSNDVNVKFPRQRLDHIVLVKAGNSDRSLTERDKVNNNTIPISAMLTENVLAESKTSGKSSNNGPQNYQVPWKTVRYWLENRSTISGQDKIRRSTEVHALLFASTERVSVSNKVLTRIQKSTGMSNITTVHRKISHVGNHQSLTQDQKGTNANILTTNPVFNTSIKSWKMILDKIVKAVYNNHGISKLPEDRQSSQTVWEKTPLNNIQYTQINRSLNIQGNMQNAGAKKITNRFANYPIIYKNYRFRQAHFQGVRTLPRQLNSSILSLNLTNRTTPIHADINERERGKVKTQKETYYSDVHAIDLMYHKKSLHSMEEIQTKIDKLESGFINQNYQQNSVNSSSVDIQDITSKVYAELENKLRIEKEWYS